ncbi:myosin-binding protein 3 [Abrus precatorius]|uniref:Myosin-binding protein 3 n=1 Tax=Abrus precatorius TaxID=3816 RepID=A0A8B8MCM2_ABRPR|nr:myosin-binding protein 3 [Abrus precatorius]XP_027365619.1 myosin-binding protein 3 [Abrus precatorius]
MVEMAAGGSGTSFVKTERMQGFTALLTSAACEWFLLFLLLLDAVLSYLLTKFASYCQLQLPCLFCSRFDHILGCQKPEFYQNLFCSNHKSEISSLIFCHIHGKLADGHRMCDDCLLSVTGKTKYKAKTHRLLVGKFGLVLGGSGLHSPSLTRDLFSGPKRSRPCTCCGKLWKSEQNSPRSIQLKSSGRAVLKPNIPLPYVPRQSRLNHRDNLKKIRDTFSESEGDNSFHPLSHVGYTELRLNSDSESEFPFSDDDDVSSVFHENMEASNDPVAQITSVPSPKCIPSDSNPAKPNGSSTKPLSFPSEQCVEPNVSKHQDMSANNPVEINLQQANQKSLSSDLPELISLDEVSSSPVVMNVSNGESESKDSKTTCLSQDSLPAPLSELMTLSGTRAHVEASSEKSEDVPQASDTGIVSEKNEDVLEKIGTKERAFTETDPMVCDSASTSPRQENSSNMSKSSATTEEKEVPGFAMEQPTSEEVDKVKEDLEQSPSHSSPLHRSSFSSVVPINHVHSPEIHGEISSSNGIQVLQKSPSMESGLESLDESNITEIEGESIVDRLRRQIEYYKNGMDALQKELEEERNASAIATNEAMSMITRLQEEKAALQMEALQYLRMMEEQAEYDNDELEKVNDLLTEKEKEIQDLEAELEYYKSNLTDEPTVPGMHEESWDSKGENFTVQNTGGHNITNTVYNFSNSKSAEVPEVCDEAVTGETSFSEFEEEKQYISKCLKSLENKLHQISCDGISVDTPSVRPENLEVGKLNQQEDSSYEGPQLDGHEETVLSIQRKIHMSNGNHDDNDGSAVSDSDDCSLTIENNHSTSVGQKLSSPRGEVELVGLENEISDLHDRLEALEFDHDLLEHIVNSLQNGKDGKQFIQDIAHRLHELQQIGLTSRR